MSHLRSVKPGEPVGDPNTIEAAEALLERCKAGETLAFLSLEYGPNPPDFNAGGQLDLDATWGFANRVFTHLSLRNE